MTDITEWLLISKYLLILFLIGCVSWIIFPLIGKYRRGEKHVRGRG